MELFAIIFAVLVLTAVTFVAFAVSTLAGSLWSGALVVLMAWGLYRAATHQSGPARPMTRETVNAFQKPLADD